eukprot:TRINITY_DN5310_c0_g1_i1.p1 TRINITY_DN5310_c0_g1~~TRINITY_DN5310_c0_g1_i1.p1  ORF type:complete len:177 (-),score=54.84 TRINITY_DN5310_c0_g1_i1:13-543(-)
MKDIWKCVRKARRTVLHYAAEKGMMEIGRMLIQYGAIIDSLDNHCNSPLDIAIENGHEEFAIMLAEEGAEIESVMSRWSKKTQHPISKRFESKLKDAEARKRALTRKSPSSSLDHEEEQLSSTSPSLSSPSTSSPSPSSSSLSTYHLDKRFSSVYNQHPPSYLSATPAIIHYPLSL